MNSLGPIHPYLSYIFSASLSSICIIGSACYVQHFTRGLKNVLFKGLFEVQEKKATTSL